MTTKSKSKKTKISDLKLNKDELLAPYIKEELNKLFYAKFDYDAELEMLKYQYDKEMEAGDERIGLHASSITNATRNFCMRDAFIQIMYYHYKVNGKKIPQSFIDAFRNRHGNNKSNPIHLQRIFEEGKSIGTKWQRLFIRGKVGVKEDMDVSRWVDEYDLSYTPDGIIVLGGKKYVVEIKSMNRNQYEQANDHKSGRKQLKLYMHFEGIDRGFVLCDCKDTSDFKVFPVTDLNESDEELANSLHLLDRIYRMKKKALKTKKLPPCTCKKCLI